MMIGKILFLIVFVGGAIFIIKRGKRIDEEIKKLLREQALKRNGKVKPSFITAPTLLFNHSGFDISVVAVQETHGSEGTTGQPARTHAKCSFRFQQYGELTLSPEHIVRKMGKFLGMQDMQIGNPEFDETFVIKANSKSWVSSLLTPEVQQKLLRLPIERLKITQEELKLTIKGNPKDTYGYDNLIDATVSVLEKTKRLRGKK
jgi:hypothetical protein